jgi:co-chaperonin GroES (HSP10)
MEVGGMKDYQNIRPLRGKVFARVLERETRVRPGALIILPKSMYGRANRARVTFAHPDCEVKAGDLIYFDAYKLKLVMEHGQLANAAGTPVANPGEQFCILEEDIFFVEEPDD